MRVQGACLVTLVCEVAVVETTSWIFPLLVSTSMNPLRLNNCQNNLSARKNSMIQQQTREWSGIRLVVADSSSPSQHSTDNSFV